ncbi:MAG: hypothetical protein ACK4FA_01220 [Candidatus Paceibacteria bacterium]
MKQVILLHKKEGETPLEALGVFRRKHPAYARVPMTYAGRLDPMASGALLVLVGEECKHKEKYLSLDKEYEFEILFGVSTDTYDILGKIQQADILENSKIPEKDLLKKIKKHLLYFKGKFTQKYPIYSSKTVHGKPLFEYGREGIDVEVPQREVSVKKLQLLHLRKITSKKLLANIEKRIGKVKGDFRQAEILSNWREVLKNKKESYYVGYFRIACSSGTYVRGIAYGLGESLGIPALAHKIKRTKIGKYAKV